ncbi:MAG: PorP/SprF family type IX secretion system membrane protein [Tunicatimonas sp.]
MKLLGILTLVAGLTAIALPGSAQLVPVQNQYFINPFTYNPAAVGFDQTTQLHTSFRKQWTGTAGSPTLATITFEKPLDRLSLGANLTNLAEGPFNSLNTNLTAGYRFRMSNRPKQWLSFGMTLGVRLNSLRTNKIDDPDDPAVLAYPSTGLVLDGGFGVRYRYERFTLGLAVPRLTNTLRNESDRALLGGLRPLDHVIGSASYDFIPHLTDWKITPTLLYHYAVAYEAQWEGMLMASFRKKFWGGAGFRQRYGLNALAGAEITPTLAFTYAYSLASGANYFPSSHEIVLRLRLDKQEAVMR